MTPKAQQLSNYDFDKSDEQVTSKKDHQRCPSTSSIGSEVFQTSSQQTSSINQVAAFLFLYNSLSSNRFTSVISPYIIFFVATPIAVHYPLIQMILLLTILIGTSPLYFVLITFIGKNNKHNNNYLATKSNHHHQNPQPHRRQPSIVGSIAEMSGIDQNQSKLIR